MNKYFRLIDLFIDNDDISRNNANFVRGIPVLEHVVVGEVMKDYLFDRIYEGLPVRAHHEEGWAYHHQTYRLSAYSYSPVNQLVVKEGEKVRVLSFEELYESLPEEEVLVDEEKEVYQKELSKREIYVLDRNGWTRLLRITKKKRQKDIVVVKTETGEMVEVTSDHPCIVGEDKDRDVKPAESLTPAEDKQFRVDAKPFLKNYAFKVKEVDAAELVNEEEAVITEDFVVCRPADSAALNGMKRRITLSQELGYFVGFFLAKGYAEFRSGIPSAIVITQKDRKVLEELQKILFKECSVYSVINKTYDGYALSVPNRTFVAFLRNFVSVTNEAPKKKLSPDVLTYSKDFVKGIIAGLLDGVGTINAHGQISLRISSPELIYQLSYVLQLLGYPPAMRFEDCNSYGIAQKRPLYGVTLNCKGGYEELPSKKFKRALEWKGENRAGDAESYELNRWVAVRSVKRIENELTLSEYEYVYDVTTESRTFVLHNVWVHNCIGLSAKDIAFHGLQSNAKNERRAAPPKRLETLFMQCANLICLIAQEVSGATSLNDLSTVAAGYLYYLEKNGIKNYSDYELENLWQEFLYNINLPFRSGNSPFSNITLDFGKPNSRLKEEPIVYAGQLLKETYKKIPASYFDRINVAFIKAMRRGDADGNPFTFPLITVNVTEDFDRNNAAWKLLLKESEYFGGFYVQNYLKEPFEKPSIYKEKNPYIKPFDEGMIYSNCCRMMFNISQVEAITGSNPFHSGSGVGGIGVYAINLNRLLFLAKDNFQLLKEMIDYTMEVGAKALQKKRAWLRKHWKDLFPYLSFYQKDDHSLYNIFSVVGVHEGMVNAGFKGGLFNDEAKDYAHRIAQYLYEKLHEFMKRDRVLYSLEYAPSENAACKMAQKDLAFANELAKALNGERDLNLSRDPNLNLFIKKAVELFGEEIFERVEEPNEV